MLRENPQTQQVAFSSSFIACRSEKGSHSLTLLHRNDSLQEPEETAWNSRRNLEILERIVTEIIRRHWSTVKRNRRRYG
ncbi:hypothetical protein TNCV_1213462 [Trichonephila clavipes]|nr:hypothetical protein TNCV_1213462 [Trichonephila clavipes]